MLRGVGKMNARSINTFILAVAAAVLLVGQQQAMGGAGSAFTDQGLLNALQGDRQ